MDDVRRSIAIDTFARTLIHAYGFTGAAAALEEQTLRDTLTARGIVDYDGLQQRGEKHLRDEGLRARLKEDGLTDSEIDELLESQPGQMPEPMFDDDPAVRGLSDRISAYTLTAVASPPRPERRSGEQRRSGVDRRRKALAGQAAGSKEQRSGVERRSGADRRLPLEPRPE